MAPQLFRVHSARHQDPPKCYINEVESFMISKLATQLCNHGHASILYVGDGYDFWTMALENLCKVDVQTDT